MNACDQTRNRNKFILYLVYSLVTDYPKTNIINTKVSMFITS